MSKEQKKHLAVIPARFGSTGVPGKNMQDLGGKPLVWHTIRQAKESGVFTDILVTSDWPEVLKLAKDEGVIALDRPMVLAGGETLVNEVITHALGVLERAGKTYDTITLLNPTSPLRSVFDIREVHRLKAKYPAPSALTVSALKPLLMVRKKGIQKWWHPGNNPLFNRQRRSAAYEQNGAVYCVDTDYFKATQKIVGEKCVVWAMPQERSVDIDTPWDLLTARAWYAESQRVGAQEIDLRQPAGVEIGTSARDPVAGEVLPDGLPSDQAGA